MHTSDNFLDIHNDGINPFTLSTRREMCSLESFSSCGWLTWSCFVYIRPPLWRHRACIATYSPRKAALTWSWWIPIELWIFLLKKLHGLIATTQMIVVKWKLTTFLRQEPWLDTPPRTRGVARLRAARGATGNPTRAWWRVQPRLLAQKRGQFLQPRSNNRMLAVILPVIVRATWPKQKRIASKFPWPSDL